MVFCNYVATDCEVPMMHEDEFPAPQQSADGSLMAYEAGGSGGSGRREPWHKPTFYELTDYMDTGGSPTEKDHGGNTIRAEDETRPAPVGSKQKMYRPISA